MTAWDAVRMAWALGPKCCLFAHFGRACSLSKITRLSHSATPVLQSPLPSLSLVFSKTLSSYANTPYPLICALCFVPFLYPRLLGLVPFLSVVASVLRHQRDKGDGSCLGSLARARLSYHTARLALIALLFHPVRSFLAYSTHRHRSTISLRHPSIGFDATGGSSPFPALNAAPVVRSPYCHVS